MENEVNSMEAASDPSSMLLSEASDSPDASEAPDVFDAFDSFDSSDSSDTVDLSPNTAATLSSSFKVTRPSMRSSFRWVFAPRTSPTFAQTQTVE